MQTFRGAFTNRGYAERLGDFQLCRLGHDGGAPHDFNRQPIFGGRAELLENLGGKVGIQHTLGGTKRQRNAGFEVACLLVNTLKRTGCVQPDRGAVHTSQRTALGTLGTCLATQPLSHSHGGGICGFASQPTLGGVIGGSLSGEFFCTLGGDLFTHNGTSASAREDTQDVRAELADCLGNEAGDIAHTTHIFVGLVCGGVLHLGLLTLLSGFSQLLTRIVLKPKRRPRQCGESVGDRTTQI